MKVLVTGGAGYIGSHATLELIQAGYEVLVLDNLCNSSAESILRITEISGLKPSFIRADICDREALDRLFSDHSIDQVFHFAGLKAVGESVSQPLSYYANNVSGSLVLLKAMANAGVFKLVFSSSATVYGEPDQMPISEDLLVSHPKNPYGRTKLIVEDILRDLVVSDPRWRIAILRYFNPVGAHNSGLIGEIPNGVPNNLFPYIMQVAQGKLSELSVFGDDYPTPDGTGVRDYIHVMDLVEGHLRALEALETHTGIHAWNLGTGKGYSVLEVIRAFEAVSGKSIPYRIVARRPGDIGICYANPAKAEKELRWKACRGLDEMIQDAWRWQTTNPYGFNS